MATVTITTLETPSRSRQAGACWAGVGTGPGSYTFGTETGRTLDAAEGARLVLAASATLRMRDRRSEVCREKIDVIVTGNPEDTVGIRVGLGWQVVHARVTGVVRADEHQDEDEQ